MAIGAVLSLHRIGDHGGGRVALGEHVGLAGLKLVELLDLGAPPADLEKTFNEGRRSRILQIVLIPPVDPLHHALVVVADGIRCNPGR